MKAEIRLIALESDSSRRNQMQAEGAGKTGKLRCGSASQVNLLDKTAELFRTDCNVMALYLIVRHRLDQRTPPFENDWFDNDNDRLRAIKTTPEIGELCSEAKKRKHLVYIHRCGSRDPYFRPMICSSAHIAKVTVSSGKTEVQFQNQKIINIRPVVQPAQGDSFYHEPAP